MDGRRTAIAAVVLLAGCAGAPQPAGTPATSPPGVYLLAADEYGAVVLDGPHGAYRGVSRNAGPAWEDTAAVRDAGQVDCLARCPDAVLSSSLGSLNSTTVPDPAPRLVVAGRPVPLDVSGHKRYVLTAAGADDFVLGAGGPDAGWWLELHSPGAVRRVPVGGSRTAWQQSADGRSALAVTAIAGGPSEARWFVRSDGMWRPANGMSTVDGSRACVAVDGSRAMLLGRRPALVDRSGIERPVTDLVVGGGCAFAGDGTAIVVELAQGPAGNRARIRVVDPSGSTRWSRDLAKPASVTADPTGPRLAYVAGGTLYEIGGRTIPDVAAARYTPTGTLVLLTARGEVLWRS